MSDVIRPAGLNSLPGIAAGFTTRAFASADAEIDDVRSRAMTAAGFTSMAGVRQVHGNEVAVVRGPGIVPDHDALVSDVPDLLLTVVAADCALVLLADADAGVVGACHSGWRGTVGGILWRTVNAMLDLGAEPGRIHSWIGPCISGEAFEVGEDVAAQFSADAVIRHADWPRPHVDLRTALRAQLDASGVSDGHVEVDERCPALDTAAFYSYRAEGGTRGRMIGYIGRRDASKEVRSP